MDLCDVGDLVASVRKSIVELLAVTSGVPTDLVEILGVSFIGLNIGVG